ncbi:unnamed protein product [Cylicocyclus nassatus]|uniref:Uncharacterized protein n=1 Tax=Cylicocyclus nassatus TaxID=53992 RepID=A0AA36MD23_CYLNA|nr:unnamed protein product [Cylicocyclus nassatus]
MLSVKLVLLFVLLAASVLAVPSQYEVLTREKRQMDWRRYYSRWGRGSSSWGPRGGTFGGRKWSYPTFGRWGQ